MFCDCCYSHTVLNLNLSHCLCFWIKTCCKMYCCMHPSKIWCFHLLALVCFFHLRGWHYLLLCAEKMMLIKPAVWLCSFLLPKRMNKHEGKKFTFPPFKPSAAVCTQLGAELPRRCGNSKFWGWRPWYRHSQSSIAVLRCAVCCLSACSTAGPVWTVLQEGDQQCLRWYS